MEKINNKIDLLDFSITTSLDGVELGIRKIINTINPHSYCIAKKDEVFAEALKASDILLPDGIGIVWAIELLLGTKIKKIAGYDLFIYLMENLNKNSGNCCFMGSSPETLDKIYKRASRDFPNVKVHCFSPPYKEQFSEKESKYMCAQINSAKPDVLFVGMTAPKQEKWIFHNEGNIDANSICCIGAVFDFYAGNIKRPSEKIINLGLEWLPRLIKEPRRLFIRNFISTPKYILEIISYKLFNRGIL